MAVQPYRTLSPRDEFVLGDVRWFVRTRPVELGDGDVEFFASRYSHPVGGTVSDLEERFVRDRRDRINVTYCPSLDQFC